MKAEEFEKKFDEVKEDIVNNLDLATARRANQEQKRINVDFPSWVVESLDRERRGLVSSSAGAFVSACTARCAVGPQSQWVFQAACGA